MGVREQRRSVRDAGVRARQYGSRDGGRGNGERNEKVEEQRVERFCDQFDASRHDRVDDDFLQLQ